MPASIRRASHGAIGRMPCGLPAAMIAVPQVAAARRVAQVDLVADLAGPAGPADDDRDAVELGVSVQ